LFQNSNQVYFRKLISIFESVSKFYSTINLSQLLKNTWNKFFLLPHESQTWRKKLVSALNLLFFLKKCWSKLIEKHPTFSSLSGFSNPLSFLRRIKLTGKIIAERASFFLQNEIKISLRLEEAAQYLGSFSFSKTHQSLNLQLLHPIQIVKKPLETSLSIWDEGWNDRWKKKVRSRNSMQRKLQLQITR